MKKTTFVDFSSILGQKLHFEKKKLEKFWKNTKNAEFPKFLNKNTLKNSKFYFVQYGPKMHKNVLWDLKKPPKSIFNDFLANLDQKIFWKKASKMHKNTVKISIFELKMTEKLENWFCQKWSKIAWKQSLGTKKALKNDF